MLVSALTLTGYNTQAQYSVMHHTGRNTGTIIFFYPCTLTYGTVQQHTYWLTVTVTVPIPLQWRFFKVNP